MSGVRGRGGRRGRDGLVLLPWVGKQLAWGYACRRRRGQSARGTRLPSTRGTQLLSVRGIHHGGVVFCTRCVVHKRCVVRKQGCEFLQKDQARAYKADDSPPWTGLGQIPCLRVPVRQRPAKACLQSTRKPSCRQAIWLDDLTRHEL